MIDSLKSAKPTEKLFLNLDGKAIGEIVSVSGKVEYMFMMKTSLDVLFNGGFCFDDIKNKELSITAGDELLYKRVFILSCVDAENGLKKCDTQIINPRMK